MKATALLQKRTVPSADVSTTTPSDVPDVSLPLQIQKILQAYPTDKLILSKLSTTHMTQTRTNPILQLLALQPLDFMAAWTTLTQWRQWAPSTTTSYLAQLVSMSRTVTNDPVFSKLLNNLLSASRTTRAPLWNPADDLEVLRDPVTVTKMPDAARFAWTTGQRIGDILRLRCDQVFKITQNQTAGAPTTIAVIFIRGKVIKSHGPYALHLPEQSWAANLVLNLVNRSPPSQYLFMEAPPGLLLTPQLEDCMMMLSETSLHQEMAALNLPKRDLRSLRRGGLVTAALSGQFSPADLRCLSRHKTDDMLRIYLGAGLFDVQTAMTQSRFIWNNEESLKHPTQLSSSSVLRLQVLDQE